MNDVMSVQCNSVNYSLMDCDSYRGLLDIICIGNYRMDKSAIWEKNARQQNNCTKRSRVLFKLL